MYLFKKHFKKIGKNKVLCIKDTFGKQRKINAKFLKDSEKQVIKEGEYFKYVSETEKYYKTVRNVIILVNIPKSAGKKFDKFEDGFTKAIEILNRNEEYKVEIVNIFTNPDLDFENYDFVCFKEGFWGKIKGKYLQKVNREVSKVVLFISSSTAIPDEKELSLYDILFYETKWYYNYANLKRHSNAYHAFGVNRDIMKPRNLTKEYDLIFVGTITDYKRPLNILKYPGKKLCLGFKQNSELVKELLENDVEVKDFVGYEELSKYYNKSKMCYVPCNTHGGGERAVLEARSCGIPVVIEEDNKKLLELTKSEIYSSKYYAEKIILGFNEGGFKTKTKLNLIFYDKEYNFGDQLNLFLLSCLIDNDKYEIIKNGEGDKDIVFIGSYIHNAKNNSYILGSGVRTKENIEAGHKYQNLNVKFVRGPLTRNFLQEKGIHVPEIYGDPALLMHKFYKPNIIKEYKDKIGFVPHKSNIDNYLSLPKNFVLINPKNNWKDVIDKICSCKVILSSSLHGLICADSYNRPNLWIDQYKLNEGDFKFRDYFQSQGREYVKIKNLNEFDEKKVYRGGNKLNLEKIIEVFPFGKSNHILEKFTVFKNILINNPVFYHTEILESVIQQVFYIIKKEDVDKSKYRIYLNCGADESFKTYIKSKYPDLILDDIQNYDYCIHCTIYDHHYDIIEKNSKKNFYISHIFNEKLRELDNVYFLFPKAKNFLDCSVLPFSNVKMKTDIPIYVVQGNFENKRRKYDLLVKIFEYCEKNKKYNDKFKIKLLGRGGIPGVLSKYKQKFIIKNNLNFVNFHYEFSDIYCILPLITKKTHPDYYINKCTSSINYSKGYNIKCLIDQDLQEIWKLPLVEIHNDNNFIEKFIKTVDDFYKS